MRADRSGGRQRRTAFRETLCLSLRAAKDLGTTMAIVGLRLRGWSEGESGTLSPLEGIVTANRVLNILLTALAVVTLPVQIVTTLVLGLLVSLTFGLLLFPISLIWMVLLGPLLGLSWIGFRVPSLRNVIGFIFLPWAAIAYEFVCLMPSMGEIEGRAAKMLHCETWPFTWAFWQLIRGRLDTESTEAYELRAVIDRVTQRDLIQQRTAERIMNGERLDPGL
jgi:hypothetical protein